MYWFWSYRVGIEDQCSNDGFLCVPMFGPQSVGSLSYHDLHLLVRRRTILWGSVSKRFRLLISRKVPFFLTRSEHNISPQKKKKKDFGVFLKLTTNANIKFKVCGLIT